MYTYRPTNNVVGRSPGITAWTVTPRSSVQNFLYALPLLSILGFFLVAFDALFSAQ